MSAVAGPVRASRSPVESLAATPERVFSGHDDGLVRCWSATAPALLWQTAHPGPVTALALRGDGHLVTACSCSCFNGSGFSLRLLNRADGKYLRRVGDEEWSVAQGAPVSRGLLAILFLLAPTLFLKFWGNGCAWEEAMSSFLPPHRSPRKTISFARAAGDHLLVGFGAPPSTVASGAVAVEHEVGRLLPLGARAREAARRAAKERPDGGGSGTGAVQAPAWGLECASALAGTLVAGTDNGLVVVSSATATHRRRVLDACSAAGEKFTLGAHPCATLAPPPSYHCPRPGASPPSSIVLPSQVSVPAATR